MVNLRVRWSELLDRTGVRDTNLIIYKELVFRYSEFHRAYHNLAHIVHCLDEYGYVRHLPEHPNEVEMAIWFHDAVYDTQANDNEERSAELASQKLREMGVADTFGERVHGLILVTKHFEVPIDIDAQVLVDVDLSILGCPVEEFNTYETGVRQEYSWIPDRQFKRGRAAILQRFLDRPTIYLTDFFRQRYEEHARQNLERSIATLRQ